MHARNILLQGFALTLLSCSIAHAVTPWRPGVQTGSPPPQNLRSVAGGAPGFYPAAAAVGGFCTTRYSGDGAFWLTHTWSLDTCVLNDVAWNGSSYLAVGRNQRTNDAVIASSSTGLEWNYNFFAYAYSAFHAVAAGPSGEFLIVGQYADGSVWTWTVQSGAPVFGVSVGTSNRLNGIAWGGGAYVAVGQGGTIVTSADGMNWSVQSYGTPDFQGVAHGSFGGKHTIVAVGNDGEIWTSTTGGSTWLVYQHPLPYTFNDVAWNGDRFVVVGTMCGVLSSRDGLSWVSESAAGECAFLNDIAWVPGLQKWVAVGDSGHTLHNESIFTSHFQH